MARAHVGFGGEKLVGWVDFGNITNCYMIGIGIHLTNSQNQPNIIEDYIYIWSGMY